MTTSNKVKSYFDDQVATRIFGHFSEFSSQCSERWSTLSVHHPTYMSSSNTPLHSLAPNEERDVHIRFYLYASYSNQNKLWTDYNKILYTPSVSKNKKKVRITGYNILMLRLNSLAFY